MENRPPVPADFLAGLLVIDVQEDFLPPVRPLPTLTSDCHHVLTHDQDGTLAVPNGRDIIPTVKQLLSMPFTAKIATKDWHPINHVSFAANHPHLRPFDPLILQNPLNEDEYLESTAWPVHCVQDTHGAEYPDELKGRLPEAKVRDTKPMQLGYEMAGADMTMFKGQARDIETYSAFYDDFKEPRNSSNELGELLRKEKITHVYVVGLAADFCVRATALHAVEEGFTTFIVEEGTRAVKPEQWPETRAELERKGVKIVAMNSQEVKMVETLPERPKGKRGFLSSASVLKGDCEENVLKAC
jgi:nicotinamidase-related amidase